MGDDVGDGVEMLIEEHHRCEALFRAVLDKSEPDDRVVEDLIRALSVHDSLESRCLYPLVEDRLPSGDQLARANIASHVELARLLAEIDRRPAGDPHRGELLAEVISTARAHFVAEEEQLFLPLRQHLAPEELLRFGQDLTRAKAKAPTRPHPHLPRFNVGTRLVAAAWRPLDRLRDTLGRRA